LKSLINLIGVVLCLGGWAVAALCVHIVRVPDAGNPQESKLVIVPKNRLGLEDTYVDARGWTIESVKAHPLLVLRLLRSGKADELRFLADPRSSRDIETQLTDYLSDMQAGETANSYTTSQTSIRSAGFSR